jgi:hypothetical protein
MDSVLVDDQQLARRDLALEVRAEEVEGAGLGGDDPAAVEPAQDERPEAVRVAEGKQLAVGQCGHGVGAFEPAHRARHRLDERDRGVRDRRGDQLGVGARAQLDAVGCQLGP